MKQRVTKAIFPVAGLGTRFLPATKSVPKEIMTLVDRPLIQYAIDEARDARRAVGELAAMGDRRDGRPRATLPASAWSLPAHFALHDSFRRERRPEPMRRMVPIMNIVAPTPCPCDPPTCPLAPGRCPRPFGYRPDPERCRRLPVNEASHVHASSLAPRHRSCREPARPARII